MIYTIRTFLVDRAARQEYVRLSEQSLWPEGDAATPTALGLWLVGLGGHERFVQLLRYDDMLHWEKTRGWAAAPARSGLVRESDSLGLIPLSRRQPVAPELRTPPGVYILQTTHVRRAAIGQFSHLTEDVLWPWQESQGGRPVGQWVSIFAPRLVVCTLTQFADLGSWERVARPVERTLGEDHTPRDAATAALAELQDLALEESLVVLRPQSRLLP